MHCLSSPAARIPQGTASVPNRQIQEHALRFFANHDLFPCAPRSSESLRTFVPDKHLARARKDGVPPQPRAHSVDTVIHLEPLTRCLDLASQFLSSSKTAATMTIATSSINIRCSACSPYPCDGNPHPGAPARSSEEPCPFPRATGPSARYEPPPPDNGPRIQNPCEFRRVALVKHGVSGE